MNRPTPEQRRSVMRIHRKIAFQKGRLCRQAIFCGNPGLAGDYAVHAARAAAQAICQANELYGELGWTVDELEKYFKLNAQFT